MSKQIRSIRGMHDVLPEDTGLWQYLYAALSKVLNAYGYAEIRLSIIELTELFTRSIGEATDIVEKEMYTFEDRNGDSLSLRPEGTAGCVRAAIEHGMLRNQQWRLWYAGPMFRHERPQKGRYRQFHQIGTETFGFPGPDIDAELIIICARFWQSLGLTNLRLEINSLGNLEARAAYRTRLVKYFKLHRKNQDEDSQRRLDSNPLRILDSKNTAMQELIRNAPQLLDDLDSDSKHHFDGLKARLDDVDIAYQVNSGLVRGLDYYTRTVFEWITDDLGAQGTVCAGGRYDGLVEHLGGQATTAAGFALGIERLIELIRLKQLDVPTPQLHAYLVAVGEQAERVGIRLIEAVRDSIPELRVQYNGGGGSFKAQIKRADRSGARFALILGDDELAKDCIVIKPLREDKVQFSIQQNELEKFLATNI